METTNKRNSNIELLRVFSMVMIIAHHYVFYGVMQNYDSDIAYISYHQGIILNKIIAQLLLPGGVVGVGIFFLIMGYFGIQSNHIKITPIVKDTLFYSILGLIIYIVCGAYGLIELRSVKQNSLSCIIPIASSTYWFVSVYIIISMMKPFLNRVVETIGGGYKAAFSFVLLLVYYSIVRYNTAANLGIIQGLVFYIIGASIKTNEKVLCQMKKSRYLVLGLTGWLFYVLFTNTSWLKIYSLNGLFSIIGLCFFGAISVFGISLFFLSGKEFVNTKINTLASTTFSVYLIHEHPLIRRLLWSNLLHVDTTQWYSQYFILLVLISIILVFVYSTIFELIRRSLLAFIRLSHDKVKRSTGI